MITKHFRQKSGLITKIAGAIACIGSMFSAGCIKDVYVTPNFGVDVLTRTGKGIDYDRDPKIGYGVRLGLKLIDDGSGIEFAVDGADKISTKYSIAALAPFYLNDNGLPSKAYGGIRFVGTPNSNGGLIFGAGAFVGRKKGKLDLRLSLQTIAESDFNVSTAKLDFGYTF